MQNLVKEHQLNGFCFFWLHEPFLMINNAKAIKFFSSEPSAGYKPAIYGVFREFLGTSLFSNEGGALYRKRRRMFNPVFKSQILKDKVSVVNKNSKSLVESLSKIPPNTPVTILEYTKIFAFSVIIEFLTGMDCNDPRKLEEMNDAMNFVDKATEMMHYRILHPWLLPKFTLQLFPKGREFIMEMERGQKLGRKLLQEVIKSGEATITQRGSEVPSEVRSRSFAELLVEYHSNDPSFTLNHMKEEFYSFLIGGYDTVAYTLMWCLFVLGHHPEVQDQVYNELETVMVNNSLSYDDLHGLRYMDSVIKETVRLYPVGPILARHLQKTVKFENYIIPKGTNIAFFPFLSHRDPEFYPDPEKFDPGRFSESGDDSQRPFIPFGEGIRNCIGKKFAVMEMKVILAHIVKNFKVISVEKLEDIHITWEIFLRTTKPLHVYLNPRDCHTN